MTTAGGWELRSGNYFEKGGGHMKKKLHKEKSRAYPGDKGNSRFCVEVTAPWFDIEFKYAVSLRVSWFRL